MANEMNIRAPGNHIMVDLETLGTKPNSLMLTIGAIRFNPFADDTNNPMETMDTFYRRVSFESFEGLDHVIDDATLEWSVSYTHLTLPTIYSV